MQRVSEVIKGCSTGQIDGLSQQIIKVLLQKGYLVEVKHPLIHCHGKQNNPYLQKQAYEALIKVVEYKGEHITINSMLRTVPQQYMIREQYEKNLCGITGAALPGRSNHHSGSAIDIPYYSFWKRTLEKFGWKWIGAWDAVHFDFPGLPNLAELQTVIFQELWNEYNFDNQLLVDGDCGAKTQLAIANSPINGFNKYPSFERGAINKDVGKLQLLLRKELGLSPDELKADYKFGKQTTKAVIAFQERQGFLVTGVADRNTLVALNFFDAKETANAT